MMRISEESQQRGDEFHISNSICPLAQKYSHPYYMNVVTSFLFFLTEISLLKFCLGQIHKIKR